MTTLGEVSESRGPARPAGGVPPVGVQPGGAGPCVRLELAWGRLRRALWRRFRPEHVERMSSLRQGACPGCPHDVIDARDLKFVRNVCGYHFGPEGDPYRGRRLFALARPGLAEVVVATVVLMGLALLCAWLAARVHWGFALAALGLWGLWAFVVSFFRDPARVIPTDAAALVSPADGRVTGIGEVEEPDFPGGRAFRISIFLSPFNVHVNRVPRSGKVVGLRYFPGKFVAATRADCDRVNEQFWLDLEEPGGRRVRVKQVSGAVARRIVCWLRAGEEVRAGERYGMIKLGSRTDVLIPAGEAVDVRVKVGDMVQGGSTVLLTFRE